MPGKSKIGWTDRTWNPVTGCTKVSSGCKHCYAETFAERWRDIPSHPYEQGFDLRLWVDRLDIPLTWKEPAKIFVNSMSDLFHPDVPFSFILKVWRTMREASHHTFQILTKRPERIHDFFQWQSAGYEFGLPNVWVGTSVEDQRWALERVPHLLTTPAEVRYLSVEPMLGRVSKPWPTRYGILIDEAPNWVIIGGESGPSARPCEIEWIRNLKDECVDESIPIFIKQLGTHLARELGLKDKKGADWDEWPPELDDLKIRQFPEDTPADGARSEGGRR